MRIHRHALGRVAQPGDLYDASTDAFCRGQSIFSEEIPKALVEVTHSNSVKCEVKHAKLREERCENLGLENEIALSILAMDIPVEGSAGYLAASRCSDGEITVAFVTRFQNSVERVCLDHEDVKRYISLDRITKSGATHVVTEVENGLTSVLSLSFDANCVSGKEHLIAEFTKAMLESLDAKICNVCETTRYADVLSSLSNFRVEFFADGNLVKHVSPTFDGYATFLKNTAMLMNEGKKMTSPVAYSLTPLHTLTSSIAGALSCPTSQVYVPVDDTTAKTVINFIEEIETCRYESSKFFHMCDTNRSLLDGETTKNMSIRMMDIEKKFKTLKQEVASEIQLYRIGIATVSAIENVVRNGSLLRNEVDRFLSDFSYVEAKLAYIAKLSSQNICILRNGDLLPEVLRTGELFVFFAKISTADEKFLKNSAVFGRLCNENIKKCVFVDTDVHQFPEHLECAIALYKDGRCIDKDVCKLVSLLQEYNVIKFKTVPKRQETKPHPRVLLEVACPKSFHTSGCDKQKRAWLCCDCQKPIEYAFNKRLCCGCGESETYSALWCCQDPGHGTQYLEYRNDDLIKQLDEIRKWKEFNVLLVGETGAGKSTWINSIANYVNHGSLDAALEAPLTCIIPCSFSVQTNASDVRDVRVGQSENEVFETGKSATQKPKTYTFMYKNELIRFIDVPGVCDTRGPDQDRKNFDLILQELRTITELHAICIVLVPDTPRLTLALQYCINELLTHLHKSASRNIVFCFTKTRQTFYKAGQTLPILKNYLSNFEKSRKVQIPLEENTMYYFDNEGFRLLCAMKDGIEFSEKERDAYRDSWNFSTSETFRFLDYVIQLEPHLTRQMLCLNETRRIIVCLTIPLAQISENIDTNLRLLEREKLEIEHLDSAVANLQPHLHRKRIVLDVKEIDYPRTVCAGPKCIKTRHLPQSEITTIHFEQTCHDHCYLPNIESEKYPCPALKNCAAMVADKCSFCGCSWDLHLHLRSLQECREQSYTDCETEKRLAEAEDDKAKKDALLKGYNDQIAVLTERHKRITEICVNFGAFLHQNSIVPYNDALVKYLKYAIKMARQEALVSKNEDRVNFLENYLKQYEEELTILKSRIAEGTDVISLDDVARLKDELFSMNTPECNIAEFLKGAQEADEKHYKRIDHFFEANCNMPTELQKKMRLKSTQPQSGMVCISVDTNGQPVIQVPYEALNKEALQQLMECCGNASLSLNANGQPLVQVPYDAVNSEIVQQLTGSRCVFLEPLFVARNNNNRRKVRTPYQDNGHDL